MIGELSAGFRSRGTIIWNFFKQLDQTFAECKYCHGLYNYATTKSHLHKHIRKKHPEVHRQFKKGKILPPAPPSDEISRTSSPEVEADESQTGDKDADEASSADVWSIFTRLDGGIAKCNVCKVKLSCEYSITYLTKHWKTEHLGAVLKCDPSENETTGNGLCDISAEENCSSTPQISQVSSLSDKPAPAGNDKTRFRQSPGWNYFTKVDKTFAECKICHLHITHLSISNLMRHVVRKHPGEIMARARIGKKRDAEGDDDLELESQVSDVEEESEEVNKMKKKASSTRGSDESLELHRSKRMRKVKVESDDVSMNENHQSSLDQEGGIVIGEDKRIDPHSYVWQVFTKLKNYFYQCKICGATIFQRSNMTSLLGHIKRTHPSFVSAMQKKLAESIMAAENRPSAESRHSTPTERAATSDEEDYEPPTGGDVVSDSDPSDAPESEERNQTSEVRQTKTGGAKTTERKRANLKRGGKTTSDEEDYEPPTGGDVVSDSEPSDAPESGEQNRASEVRQTKTNERKRANRKRKGKTKRAKSGKPKAEEREHQKAEARCLLSERFTDAIEEGNLLMKDLQGVVERQGRALERIAACLEGMSRLTKNKG